MNKIDEDTRMYIAEKIRAVAYPLVTLVMVGSLWIFAWSQSLQAKTAHGYWAPENPGLCKKASELGGSSSPVAASDLDRACRSTVADDRD